MDVFERGAWQVVETLEAAGYEAYLVGGCVRDLLLGRAVNDYDITTSAMPDDVLTLFPDTIPTGLKHGTVTVLIEGVRYEVTTYRTDGEYEDGRRPRQVVFVRSLTEDLARRDFTINAMALGIDGEVRDPFQGRQDLRQKRIRAVGDALLRFQEDALRMLRAIRFAAQLGFVIEEDTLAAIRLESQDLKRISRERIRDEWHKMLLSAPDVALPLLRETDALRYVLSRPQTFDVAVHHPWGPLGHGVDPWQLAGEWAARVPQDLALRYCVVLEAVKTDEARMERTLQELKLSGQLKREIRGAWAISRFGDPGRWSDRQWRELFFSYGRHAVRRGCLLFAAIHEPERMAWREAEVERRAELQPLWSLQDLAVSGQDLLAAGVPAGPQLGKTLNRLAAAVLREPECNERDELLRLAMAADAAEGEV